MKKRVLPILIVLAALISLLVIPANASTSNTLLAGYDKVTIDPYYYPEGPLTGLPMGGYGAVTERLSGDNPGTTAIENGRMDDNGDGKIDEADGLFATCTAITDQYGTTLIHFGIDNLNGSTAWTNDARNAVVTAVTAAGYEVNYANVFVTVSHSHSSPQINFDTTTSNVTNYPEISARTKLYREWVISQMATAAVNAMKDQEEVIMTKGSVDASDAIGAMYPSASDAQKRMNWVRHYTSTTKSSGGETIVGGSNFGAKKSYNVKEVSSPNDVMQLVQFTPISGKKDPIVLVNWTAHSTINSSGGSGGANDDSYGGIHHYDVSADYPGALRNSLETGECYNATINNNYFSKSGGTQTFRVSFISGAAGNVTPSTAYVTSMQDPDVKGTSSKNKSTEGHLYGQKLAAIARYGLTNLMSDALDTSAIRVQTENFTYDIQQPTESDRDFIYSMRKVTVNGKNLVSYLTTNSTNWAKRSNYYTQFPYLKKFTSRYQLSNMNGRVTTYYDNGSRTSSITVSAIAIGTQLSITVNPCELADRFSDNATLGNTKDNDWDDLKSSTYGTPLIMGYTNGSNGYVPNSLAYNYNSGYVSKGGDGADISDNYITGSYESSGASYARGTGEKLMQFYVDMLADVNTTNARVQCECGGKAEGMPGHTCKMIEFLPWTSSDSLPSSGNYYLTCDIVRKTQLDSTSILRLDLNGYDITYQVPAKQGELALAGSSHGTRVFSMASSGYLSITDSSENGTGTIKRDLSNLTDEQKAKITNYGLIVLLNGNSTGVLYNGTLDAQLATTDGGGVFSAHDAGTTFKMYGGALKGATANNGGIGRVNGTAEFYGGTVTGGRTKVDSARAAGIHVVNDGKLIIGGSVVIKDNKKSNGVATNIRFDTVSKMATNFTVRGDFTGEAGLLISTRESGQVIGKSDNAAFTAKNLYLDYYSDFDIAISGNDIILAKDVRKQCECGSKIASGTYDHICKEIDFLPWTSNNSLPTKGNYYLTTDVTLSAQQTISSGALCLDLNSHNITYVITEAEAAKIGSTTHNTRVFSVGSNARLSITDSTDKPGTVKRNLKNLTDTQKYSITNYGLLILTSSSNEVTIYDGIFDATGSYTGGSGSGYTNGAGAGFCTFSDNSKLTMYGGQLKGGVCNRGGLIGVYKGTVAIYGGTLSGGDTRSAGENCGGIYVFSTGKLIIGGSAVIDDNMKYLSDTRDTEINIRYAVQSKMATNFIVRGNFTGKVGINVASPTAGMVIGVSDGASFTSKNLYFDVLDANIYKPAISGNSIVALVKTDYAASITDGETVTHFDKLSEAITAYPGGTAVITLLNDSNENVTFTQDTILDLNACDLTGVVKSNGTLTVMDSQTDDFTVTDHIGYGKLPVSLTNAVAADGYVLITEADGISVHKVLLDTVGITLRPSTTGIYYTSDFGGDEVIKRNVKSFGIALGANKEPDFSEKTYTAFSSDNWISGKNADGSTKNRTNGTLLQGILSPNEKNTINRRNAALSIWGFAYVELLDGTRLTEEPTIKYSLRNVIEGFEGFNGVDDLWDALTDTQKRDIVNMYGTYESIMKNWDIPNIKQGYAESQDDGVLKILMIGNSLGMNSTYFLPEVLRNETGEDVVVGTMYHSGCRLSQHVDFLTSNVTEYAYMEYDTEKHSQWQIWENSIGVNGFVNHTPGQAHDSYIGTGSDDKYGVTLKFGVQQHDWDIIVMQAGVFEAANFDDSEDYDLNITADIKTIQNYIEKNDTNAYTKTKFAWNITWSAPEDKSLTANTYYETYLANGFNNSSEAMYEAIINTYKEQIATAYDWDYVFPAGTLVQNAKTILPETKIYRETVHATDLTQLAIAYTWYCELFDQDISYCGFDPISSELRRLKTDRDSGVDYSLTVEEKGIVKDCVRNAIAKYDSITQIQEDDDVLKVLIIGHSTGMDPAYFTPIIAKANGTKMIIGDLYHSGCKLSQHDSFIQGNSKEYAYLEYDNTKDTTWRIWETEEGANGFVAHVPGQAHDIYIGAGAKSAGNPNKYGVTMDFGIKQHDWDIVIMMGGRWETTDITVPGSELDITDIGVIRDHVLANDIDKTTVPDFAWNSLWTNPEKSDTAWVNSLTDSWKNSFNAAWDTIDTYYNGSTETLFEHIMICLNDIILPAYNFDYLLFNTTVYQNAKSAGLSNAELYRDYTHATDFGRVMIACNWYCGLTGSDIEEITIPSIPYYLRYKVADRNSGKDYTLTSDQLKTIVKCVKNAIENPFKITK